MFDPSRLYTQLLNTGLAIKDNPLYQLIRELIDALSKITGSVGTTTIGSGSAGALVNQSYITANNDTAILPNSRKLVAGTDIAFDITIPGQMTLNSSFVEKEWSVLTNGNVINPELIFAGGDVIMTHTP